MGNRIHAGSASRTASANGQSMAAVRDLPVLFWIDRKLDCLWLPTVGRVTLDAAKVARVEPARWLGPVTANVTSGIFCSPHPP